MKAKLLAVYAALFAAAVGVFFGVRELGNGITPTGEAHAAPAKPSGASGDGLFHVLLALLAVLVVARLVGLAFKRFGQPAVIGEVVAGLLLAGGNPFALVHGGILLQVCAPRTRLRLGRGRPKPPIGVSSGVQTSTFRIFFRWLIFPRQ